MTSFLLYLVKVNILVVVFFAFYRLTLRRETFFICNRFYALGALVASLTLPFVDFSSLFSNHHILLLPLPAVDSDIQVSGAAHAWCMGDYVSLIIIAGTVLLITRLFVQLISLLQLKKRTTPGLLCKVAVQLMHERENPFSFLHWIFINPALYQPAELHEIVAHEHIHVRQWHTLDILLFEAFAAFCWYNPMVWLMKQSVKQNLEFIADRKILKAGYDKYKYQCNLLKATQFVGFSEITASFNHHCLQNRIAMMNKAPSRSLHLIKYTLIVPICAGTIVCLDAKAELSTVVGSVNNGIPAVVIGETIVFDKFMHDFGTIRESDGKTSAIFTFVNHGVVPVIISDVKASCGCTTPEWTKEPVVPGGKGYVKATYDPTNRIYAFDRTLTVYSNGKPSEIELHIKGITIKQ